MKNQPGFSRSRRSGFALVTVLIIMILLVVLIMTFLMRASTERKGATNFHGSTTARQLADVAVALVQGQINLATTQGSTIAWASQPGMLRTFNSNGGLVHAYKLYSSAQMILGTDGSTLALTDFSSNVSLDLPQAQDNWAGSPALWTDLNLPVKATTGAEVFPIVDPNALGGPASTAVQGFSVTGPPSGGVAASNGQAAPMPMRWLYILEDGSLVCPTGSGSTAVVPGETANNKIVGRIAFWTDDDSCRVNINTASAGTFWDVPRGYSTIPNSGIPPSGDLTKEQGFGYYQPEQKEFQRYPGHPAMTDLRAVFPGLTAEQIYNLVPRIVGGGSTEGTVHVPTASTLANYPKNQRLYADVDELLFTPARAAQGLTTTQLEQSKFFLTAQSRAPETNLFNLPRVACWPINADLATNPLSPYTSAFDRLIAFCASTGPSTSPIDYYFQRKQALDATTDISIPRNQQLYSYLQYLTSQEIPGFGGNFLGKYPSPGGGLPSDRDEILTEIFDYIRSTNLYDTTLPDPVGHSFTATSRGWVTPTLNKGNQTLGFGRAYTLAQLGIGFICNADGSIGASNVIPPSTLANRVLGGVPLAPGQRYIQSIILPEFFSAMHGIISITPDMNVTISGLDSLQVNGLRLFPNGTEGPVHYHDVRPDGSSLTIGPSYQTQSADIFGANPGWRYCLLGQAPKTPGLPGGTRISPARGNLPADPTGGYELYPFIGTPVIVNSGATMNFSGGSLTVTISDPSNNAVQTINLTLPPAPIPMPTLVTNGTPNEGAPGIATTSMQNWWAFAKTGAVSGFSGRLTYAGQPATDMGNPATCFGGVFLQPTNDVLRSILPANGDYRLIAGRATVPSSLFVPHPNYSGPQMFASNLSNTANTLLDPGFGPGGKYLSTLTYPVNHQPDIISSAVSPNTPDVTGDFDDSLPDIFPGPYVNKPDEGADVKPGLATSIPYYYARTVATAGNSTGIDLTNDGGSFFSPNRMMPSPGMFGSLPTGVMAGKPWQTLLFRHQPSHPGALSPADHLMLDLFWMPVVDPYAISDRFSTAGKINLNYQIMPFTYIKRQTGLYALLDSEMVTSMPATNAFLAAYKVPGGTGTAMRHTIDVAQTLSQFDAKFNTGDIFKSASEICNEDIVPTGQTEAGMSTYWKTNALTGDNVREKIYTTLYPRMTTKSNTYTVYFEAQSLKKATGSALGTWNEGKDQVLGEYRGSAEIERFIDANNSAIPDYAASSNPAQLPTLDTFYRWRVIANRQFAP